VTWTVKTGQIFNITSTQREADTNRQLYDALLQRYKEIGVAGSVGVNNIAIVEPAIVPDAPSSPNMLTNIIIALIFGYRPGFVYCLCP